MNLKKILWRCSLSLCLSGTKSLNLVFAFHLVLIIIIVFCISSWNLTFLKPLESGSPVTYVVASVAPQSTEVGEQSTKAENECFQKRCGEITEHMTQEGEIGRVRLFGKYYKTRNNQTVISCRRDCFSRLICFSRSDSRLCVVGKIFSKDLHPLESLSLNLLYGFQNGMTAWCHLLVCLSRQQDIFNLKKGKNLTLLTGSKESKLCHSNS